MSVNIQHVSSLSVACHFIKPNCSLCNQIESLITFYQPGLSRNTWSIPRTSPPPHTHTHTHAHTIFVIPHWGIHFPHTSQTILGQPTYSSSHSDGGQSHVPSQLLTYIWQISNRCVSVMKMIPVTFKLNHFRYCPPRKNCSIKNAIRLSSSDKGL